jgi:hypothetical protein
MASLQLAVPGKAGPHPVAAVIKWKGQGSCDRVAAFPGGGLEHGDDVLGRDVHLDVVDGAEDEAAAEDAIADEEPADEEPTEESVDEESADEEPAEEQVEEPAADVDEDEQIDDADDSAKE